MAKKVKDWKFGDLLDNMSSLKGEDDVQKALGYVIENEVGRMPLFDQNMIVSYVSTKVASLMAMVYAVWEKALDRRVIGCISEGDLDVHFQKIIKGVYSRVSPKSSKKLRPPKQFKDINIETTQRSFYQQIEQKRLDEVVKKIIMWSKGKFYTDFRMTGTYTRCVFVLSNTDTFWINSKGVLKFSKHNISKLKPFNDEKYYREFIQRLPKIKELSTRPYISLSFLKSQNELKELLSTLEWFIDTISAIKH